jgi:phospholipid transport system substrate-binding protein
VNGRKRCVVLAAGFFTPGGRTALSAANPKEELKASIDRVLDVLRDPPLKGDEHRKARRQKLVEIIQARFDFAEMGKRSLARQWRKMDPAERKEFVGIFGNLLKDSYLTKIEAFTDEKIVYPTERMEEDYAEVRTRIVQKSGRGIGIDYRLHRTPDGWRVYDFMIEGVSLVANYRKQFKRLIRKTSYKELIARMKVKDKQVRGDSHDKEKTL